MEVECRGPQDLPRRVAGGKAGTMERVRIRVKRLNREIALPKQASNGASGMDLRASLEGPVTLFPGEIRRIPTGLCLAIPEGFEAQIRPRSGWAFQHGVGLLNSPGTIDADYRGEIGILLVNWGKAPVTVRPGDRIAQMVINRVWGADLVEVDALDDTPRGEGGFGHTGMS